MKPKEMTTNFNIHYYLSIQPFTKANKFIILFFLFFIFKSSYAQTSYNNLKLKTQNLSYFDSIGVFQTGRLAIQQAVKEGKPELEAEILIYFGNHYYYRGLYDKAIDQYQKAVNVAMQFGNQHYLHLANIRLAYILNDKGQKEKSINIFNTILLLAKENNDYIIQIECLNALALMQDNNYDYAASADLYMQALKIAETNKDDYYTALILNNLGLIKLSLGKQEEALKDYNKAYELAVQINNPRLAAHLSNNIALIYAEQKKFNEAITFHKNNLKYAKLSGNHKELFVAYLNLSAVYGNISELNKALLYSDSAINLLKSNLNLDQISKAYLNRAQILIKQKKYSDAIKMLDVASSLSDSLNDLEGKSNVFYLLSSVYEKQYRFQDALDEYKKFKQYDDSLKQFLYNKQLGELEVQYQLDKKEEALELEKQKSILLENENRLKDTRFYFTLVFILLLLFLMAASIYMLYNRSRRIQQQKFSQHLIRSIEEERSRIAKDLHDDIGQSLSALKSRIILADKNNNKQHEFDSEIQSIIDKTREISRNLYPSYLEKIGFTRSIAQLMEKVQNNTALVCSFEIDEEIENATIDKKTQLYRIVQECVNNTIKHANAKSLKLVLEKINDKNEFILIYRDNGKGLNTPDSNMKKGIGFMIMNERANILDGNISIENNLPDGFKLIVNFKI